MSAQPTNRNGIAGGGNWIVDRVKTVDTLPRRGMLANIRAQQLSPGGAPANVLADLARLGANFPLAGLGVVGDDADGRYLLATYRTLGVDVTHLATTNQAPTSYTDVMNEESTGDRIFYHHRGANALFGPQHVPIAALTCRIFHLGYLLLLDAMDRPDPQHGTVAARLLRDLQQAGIRTSVDVVSEQGDRFRTIVPPALRHVDYLILNEIEAAAVTGCRVRNDDGQLDPAALVEAVERLHTCGTMQLVAVHMPEGFYLREGNGRHCSRGALQLPDGYIAGTVGAGDAFCAGMLFGLHEAWPAGDAAQLGTLCAAASLAAPGASDGVRPLPEVLALAGRYPERPAPVPL